MVDSITKKDWDNIAKRIHKQIEVKDNDTVSSLKRKIFNVLSSDTRGQNLLGDGVWDKTWKEVGLRIAEKENVQSALAKFTK